jgi:hypothetical protein
MMRDSELIATLQSENSRLREALVEAEDILSTLALSNIRRALIVIRKALGL